MKCESPKSKLQHAHGDSQSVQAKRWGQPELRGFAFANRSQSLVPKGRARIAQCFSFGFAAPHTLSHEGTAERLPCTVRLSRPFGTRFSRGRCPTLKRWAILKYPSGIERNSGGFGAWCLVLGIFCCAAPS